MRPDELATLIHNAWGKAPPPEGVKELCRRYSGLSSEQWQAVVREEGLAPKYHHSASLPGLRSRLDTARAERVAAKHRPDTDYRLTPGELADIRRVEDQMRAMGAQGKGRLDMLRWCAGAGQATERVSRDRLPEPYRHLPDGAWAWLRTGRMILEGAA